MFFGVLKDAVPVVWIGGVDASPKQRLCPAHIVQHIEYVVHGYREYCRMIRKVHQVDFDNPGRGWRKIVLRGVLTGVGWRQVLRGGGWICLSVTDHLTRAPASDSLK